jgi:N-acetyl-anhydromuramyl-L-alanine amidase AmpD
MARKATDFIIIHCSATGPSHDLDIGEIDRWHRQQNWRMVGYHYLIRRDGTVQTGRPLMDGGAHAGPEYNNRSVGVCLAGGIQDGRGGDANRDGETAEFENGKKGVPEANYTPAQWAALACLVRELRHRFPQAQVIGHRDVNPHKACPCFDVKSWWAEVEPGNK